MEQLPFQAIFEHSSIGIIISDIDGNIQKINPFASKTFGYNSDELVGQKIEILIPSQLKEKHIGYRKIYTDNPLPRTMGSNLNLYAVKKNGEQFPVEISLSYFESSGYRRIVSFVNDITIRKKSENELKKMTEELESQVKLRTLELSDALEEINRTNEGLKLEMVRRERVEEQILSTLEKEKQLSEMKSRFVSMASHEFRTPLSGIMTSAALISRYNGPEDVEKRNKHILTIKKSVKNLTTILNDFLSLDKLNQGKIVSHPSQFLLIELLKELIEEFTTINEKNQTILIQNTELNLNLFHDKDLLRNILTNLISNAIKYSHENALITINHFIENDKLVIQVIDQGIGIPEEGQKHLFELFFRANNVENIQGTGLGLSIVKQYLGMMRGELNFTSIENKGTTFSVILPMEKN